MAGLTVLLYLPSLGNGYVGWDDGLILAESHLRSLTPGNLLSIFIPRSGGAATYQPLRTLAYAIVYAFSGTSPAGYIVLNILLHALTVALFYFFVLRLVQMCMEKAAGVSARAVAFYAALIFGLHPLHVETVSWLQGGKFPLLGVFFLGSLTAWLRFRGKGGWGALAVSFGLYCCALASQPGAVALPLVLLAFEWLFPRQPGSPAGWKRWGGLVLFFLPAAAAGIQLAFLSTVTQTAAAQSTVLTRLFNLPLLWASYIYKFVLPLGICCRYPLSLSGSTPYIEGSAGLAALGAAVWLTVRHSGAPRLAAFGWAVFGATLVPTSGLVPTSTLMADRYFFLPGLGVSLVAGLLAARLAGGEFRLGRYQALAVLALAGLGLGVVTVRRESDWRDPFSLWSRVLKVYPRHDLASFNLARAYQDTGALVQADSLYRRAIQINHSYGDAYANLGVVLRVRGDSLSALSMLQRAAELRPDRGAIWVNLGISYAGLGRDSMALAAFSRGIGCADKWEWQARYNRAKLWLDRGRTEEALAEIDHAVRTWPELFTTEAWLDLGRTLERSGKVHLAAELLALGSGENAFSGDCWRTLGNLQLLDSRPAEALYSLQRALKGKPNDYRSLVLLGVAWQQNGKHGQAVDCYMRALSLPGADKPRVRNYLALALAGVGKPAEALGAWRLALQEDPGYLEGWINLGLFQRGLGREEEARGCLNRALELCRGKPELDKISARLRELLGPSPENHS